MGKGIYRVIILIYFFYNLHESIFIDNVMLYNVFDVIAIILLEMIGLIAYCYVHVCVCMYVLQIIVQDCFYHKLCLNWKYSKATVIYLIIYRYTY